MLVRQPAFLGLVGALISHYVSGCTPYYEPRGNGERGSGECPADEECSDETPHGLYFQGPGMIDLPYYAVATAVGGTQELTLATPNSRPFERPYVADDDGGESVQVTDQDAGRISVRAVTAGSNYLRIVSESTGLLFDRIELHAAPIAEARLTVPTGEVLPLDPELVWVANKRLKVGVALFGDVLHGGATNRERLVDTSMTIQLAGTTKFTWDAVEGALPVGAHTLVATTGDGVAHTLEVEAVAGPDEISSLSTASLTATPGGYAEVCFQATHEGRYVYGLEWSFSILGTSAEVIPGYLRTNCAQLTARGRAGDTLQIVGRAGGITGTVPLRLVGADGEGARMLVESAAYVSQHANRMPIVGQRAAMIED